MLMDISVGDLHNDTIKQFNNYGLEKVVDSVTQEVLISDTKLISFIPPPQVRKMNPKLHHICGCVKIDLNIFRTILVKYLQQKSFGRHTHNSFLSLTVLKITII